MKNQFVILPEFIADSERRRQLFLFSQLAQDATGVHASTLANLCALFRGDVRLVRKLLRRRVILQDCLTPKSNNTCSLSRTSTSVTSDSSFRCEGEHVQSFGRRGSGPGELNCPVGCALSVDACYVYVADYGNHRVCVFDASSGAYRHSFGSRGRGEEQFSYPAAVSVSDAGHLYVCDCENHRVQVLNAVTGAFVRLLGTSVRGSVPGQLEWPSAVVVSRHRVFVCDYARVSVFDESNGAFLHSFGTLGVGDCQSQFCYNTDITVSAVSGDVYVAERDYSSSSSRVQVFNEHGEFERVSWRKQTHSCVIRVSSVCLSATDDVYVSDTSNQCVHVFDSSGAYVRPVGVRGSGSGINPRGVALSRDGRLFVVDQKYNRVCVYE